MNQEVRFAVVEEKRMYPRVETINLISYFTLDKSGNKQSQGMGMARDISQNGLRVETPQMIDSEFISILSNDMENNLIKIKGKVVYCKQTQSKKFVTGICFQGTNEEKIQFVKGIVKVFNSRKKNVPSSYLSKDKQQQPIRF